MKLAGIRIILIAVLTAILLAACDLEVTPVIEEEQPAAGETQEAGPVAGEQQLTGEGEEGEEAAQEAGPEEGAPAEQAGEAPGQSEQAPGQQQREEDENEDEGARCTDGTGPTAAVERLAAQFGIGIDEVMAWFCVGYGLGEIRQAYEISAASDQVVAEIFAMRESGMGWGEIRQEFGLIGAGGEDEDEDQDQDEDEDGEETARCTAGAAPTAAMERLAAQFGISADEVMTWFCAGYGLGEIKRACEISAASGRPLAEIFAMRESGMGWGTIRQELGLIATHSNAGGNSQGQGRGQGQGQGNRGGQGDQEEGTEQP